MLSSSGPNLTNYFSDITLRLRGSHVVTRSLGLRLLLKSGSENTPLPGGGLLPPCVWVTLGVCDIIFVTGAPWIGDKGIFWLGVFKTFESCIWDPFVGESELLSLTLDICLLGWSVCVTRLGDSLSPEVCELLCDRYLNQLVDFPGLVLRDWAILFGYRIGKAFVGDPFL